ncbi:VOC family protein [Priestia taiwanensis]|uniref:VOC family protein n=1 Tax=Priestia taiwanensis TaxID=1347902 RepID=A0A917AXJ9_9BACI|nr:VOC family protein [Priestia taiwanensis]MBM7365032.1 putative 3-demethylubiquinone-9 3-methyltransferase (glyoxalase superfamily) [Priestia taiwanensis]GGE83542.1 VOC family protein [Priestia taiwanensis]
MGQKITTFLMFNGKAEEAMNFYTSIFDGSEIGHIVRHGAHAVGEEELIMHATFSLKGQTFMCLDNNNGDEHKFTPAMSLFVTCDTEEEIEHVFEQLSEGGAVLMPLGPLPMSEKFAWVEDKYGVSWQLNLPKAVG